MRKLPAIFALAGSTLGGFVMFAAGVRPEDAASNLAAWLAVLGFENVPQWIAVEGADKWAFAAGVILAAFGAASGAVAIFSRGDSPAEDAREFIDASPSYLVGLCEKVMEVQAREIVRPYIGKWMKLECTLKDIWHRGIDERLIFPFEDTSVRVAERDVTLRFKAKWRRKIILLPRGTKMLVVGRISDVSRYGVTLRRCDLLEYRPPGATRQPASPPDTLSPQDTAQRT
jgi:hypothetical protein